MIICRIRLKKSKKNIRSIIQKHRQKKFCNGTSESVRILKQSVSEPTPLQKTMFTEKLDDILLHRRWGYLILLVVLFLLFQSVFWLAEYPMNFIEWAFAQDGSLVQQCFT